MKDGKSDFDRRLMVGMFMGDYVRGCRMTNGLYLHHPTPCLITACKKNISMLIETECLCISSQHHYPTAPCLFSSGLY